MTSCSSSLSTSPYYYEIEELQHLENAPRYRKNSKKILSRQLSMLETSRDLAWEKKRRQMLKQERKREISIANPNEHVSDEDVDELKGCIELGFGFNEEKGGQDLANTLPALDFYFAINRLGSPVSSPRGASSPRSKLLGFGSSSSKSLDEGRSSISSEDSWKIFSQGEDPQHVKTKLRHWAQVVACSVTIISCLTFVAETFKVDVTGEKAEPSRNNEDDDGIDWE
ncbi:hypothetical protein Tco_1533689 [Tanacetum coccineum]